MPNTLVHLGLQGISSRAAYPDIGFRWIAIGCVIPDIPWIVHRIVRAAGTGLDLYDVRLYAMIQASFGFCILIAAALALLSTRPRTIFAVLSANAFIHLLLDALELKWGNGVHLWGPLHWSLTNFGVVWPEHAVITVLSVGGALFALWIWPRRSGHIHVSIQRGRTIGAVILVTFYGVAPLFLLDRPQALDAHSIQTLRNVSERPGRHFALDRGRCVDGSIITFTHERLPVEGAMTCKDGTVSIQAQFIDSSRIELRAVYPHWGRTRDYASMLGLLLCAAMWLPAPQRK
jgi:hypothetical protein